MKTPPSNLIKMKSLKLVFGATYDFSVVQQEDLVDLAKVLSEYEITRIEAEFTESIRRRLQHCDITVGDVDRATALALYKAHVSKKLYELRDMSIEEVWKYINSLEYACRNILHQYDSFRYVIGDCILELKDTSFYQRSNEKTYDTPAVSYNNQLWTASPNQLWKPEYYDEWDRLQKNKHPTRFSSKINLHYFQKTLRSWQKKASKGNPYLTEKLNKRYEAIELLFNLYETGVHGMYILPYQY